MKKSRKTPARKRPTKRARSSVRANKPARSAAPPRLPAATPGLRTIAIPRIGEYWPGQGGILHAVMAGQDGKPDYLLISAEKKHHHQGTSFDEMQAYAKGLTVDGHSDFAMPTRKEQRAQWANAKPGQFDDAYYWSCEQCAYDSDDAWGQYFGNGGQNGWHEDDRFRGCPVRRVPI